MNKPRKCKHMTIFVPLYSNDNNEVYCATSWCEEKMNLPYLLEWEWQSTVDSTIYERLPKSS